MQGVGKSGEGVLVLGATNVPWELDPAMRRRFEKRVYISLPDAPARAKMFELNLGDTENDVSTAQFNELGRLADGCSGSDISVVTREALMEPLRHCQEASHFVPCTHLRAPARPAMHHDTHAAKLPQRDSRCFLSAVYRVNY